MDFTTLSYELSGNGVAMVIVDVPDHKHNVITPELHAEIGALAIRLGGDESAKGAVLSSGKPTFMAGGDLKRIASYYDMRRSAEEAYRESRLFTESLRALETCGKPVAVAINGTALGGGLELALACNYRVALDREDILLGLPEVTLGLIPGAGGTQRLPRMIGIRKAAELILPGQRVSPDQALELGIVDQLVSEDQLLAAAEKWVLDNGEAAQPWDRRGFRIPGGSGLSEPGIGGLFIQLTAQVSAEHRHNYPAPVAALRALFNGTTVRSMDQALQVESREFSALTRDPVARNIIRTLFINRGRRARLDGEAKQASKDSQEAFAAVCRDAYQAEAQRMLEQGVSQGLIRNAAFVAGMAEGPWGEDDQPGATPATSGNGVDAGALGERLLSAQALAAVEAWLEGSLDPVDADLGSILQAGFPSYTGGVMSYIDTLGLGGFIRQCKGFEAGWSLSPALQDQADQQDRIYPPAE